MNFLYKSHDAFHTPKNIPKLRLILYCWRVFLLFVSFF